MRLHIQTEEKKNENDESPSITESMMSEPAPP